MNGPSVSPSARIDVPRSRGVSARTSDYIGVYTSVKASGGCDGLPDVGRTPPQIAAVIRQDPDLEVTQPRQTEVGGLRGLVMDIELSQNPGLDGSVSVQPCLPS
jgi:hypothetical protein